MEMYVKYVLLITGILAAAIGIVNRETAPAIVSVGALIAFAIIERIDLKTSKDNKD